MTKNWFALTRFAFFPATIWLLVGFIFVMKLNRTLKPYPILWYIAFVFVGIPFLILDVLYNFIIGSIIWWELPKELLYTERLKRKKREGYEEAFKQCEKLKKYDPTHC
jgi:hypothetical protein